jgi:hypothetical protein
VNLENISPINLPILIYTIANIIDDNKGGKQEYMASFTKRAFSENSNIFTPEERAVFDIYKEKIVSGTIAIWLKWYLEAIGWVK